MNIRIRETLNIKVGDKEHVVRAGTMGVEKSKIVYFYDTTRSCAVGFSREVCLENLQVFSVTRNIEDREVPLLDVLSEIKKVEDPRIREGLIEAIRAI